MTLTQEVEKVFKHEVDKLNNPYLINRMLSSIPKTILLAIRVNPYIGKIPNWAIKSIYLNSIKKRKNLPGSPRHYWKKKEVEPKLMQKISQSLCCSERHAKETIRLLRKLKYKPEQFFGLKKGD